MTIPFKIATACLGPAIKMALTPEQRAAAEHTATKWFCVARQLTQAQCDAQNRADRKRYGYGNFLEIYPGWYTFFVNAKGEHVDGCGDYGNRDAALWNFHELMTGPNSGCDDQYWEDHKRSLGFTTRRAA